MEVQKPLRIEDIRAARQGAGGAAARFRVGVVAGVAVGEAMALSILGKLDASLIGYGFVACLIVFAGVILFFAATAPGREYENISAEACCTVAKWAADSESVTAYVDAVVAQPRELVYAELATLRSLRRQDEARKRKREAQDMVYLAKRKLYGDKMPLS